VSYYLTPQLFVLMLMIPINIIPHAMVIKSCCLLVLVIYFNNRDYGSSQTKVTALSFIAHRDLCSMIRHNCVLDSSPVVIGSHCRNCEHVKRRLWTQGNVKPTFVELTWYGNKDFWQNVHMCFYGALNASGCNSTILLL
jgi:hypothetical protein